MAKQREARRIISEWALASVGVFLVSYPVHLTWEMLQTPLYECSKLLGKELIPHLLWATLGDAVMMVGLYWLGGLLFWQKTWPFRLDKWRVSLVLLYGLVMSVFIELRAVFWEGRWFYTELMPTAWGIGLVPVLQLLILPFLIFWLVGRLRFW